MSEQPRSSYRNPLQGSRDGWWALLTAVILLWWMPPGIWWKDAGQLGAAALGNGVAHPSGFPAYLLFAKAFSFVPVAHSIFRVGLLSVLSAGVTVFFFGQLVRTYVRPATAHHFFAMAILVLGLLGAHLFVLHGTTPEVYMPTLACLAGLLRFAVPGEEEEPTRLWPTAGIFTALGLGMHFSAFVVAAAPIWAVAFWRVRTLQGRIPWGPAFSAVGIGLIGLVTYFSIPWHSLHDPFRNWGYPDTLGKTWDHLTAVSIRAAFQGRMLDSGPTLSLHLARHLESLGESAGLFLVTGPLLGVMAVFRKHAYSPVAMTLLGVLLCDTGFTVWVNPMGIADRQTGLHSAWACIALTGFTPLFLFQELPGLYARWVPGMVSLLLPLAGTALHQETETHIYDRSAVNFPDRYRDAMLADCPTGAVLLTGNDDSLGVLNYAFGVEHTRPDLTFVALPHVYSLAMLEHSRRLYSDDLFPNARIEASRAQATREGWLGENLQIEWIRHWVENRSKPVVWGLGELAFDQKIAPFLQLHFPLNPVRSPNSVGTGQPFWVHYGLKAWEGQAGRLLDPISSGVFAEQSRLHARVALEQGKVELALQYLTLATDLASSRGVHWGELGIARFRAGDLPGAENALRLALFFEPERSRNRVRLMELLVTRKAPLHQLEREAEEVEHWSPGTADSRNAKLAVARHALESGKNSRAREWAARVLQEDPSDREALEIARSTR